MNKIRPKKERANFFLIVIILLSFLCLPQLNLAATDQPLLSELKFDPAKRVLTGKTVPNANISLAELVAEIVADDQGNFKITIPADLTRSTLSIADYLNNQSTDVAYDFVAGTITTASSEPQLTKDLAESTTRTNLGKTTPQQTKDVPESKQPNIILWVLLLVSIIIATVLGLLYLKQLKTLTTVTRTSKKKKRKRKRKNKTN